MLIISYFVLPDEAVKFGRRLDRRGPMSNVLTKIQISSLLFQMLVQFSYIFPLMTNQTKIVVTLLTVTFDLHRHNKHRDWGTFCEQQYLKREVSGTCLAQEGPV